MPSITDSIGRVLGDRYRLVTALGTGASAHVYLADDVSLHRRVAIKVLHPALAGDTAFLKRFRAEARAVAALNHPNILQVYDWGEEHGQPYLVLEYLAGGSLRQVYDTGVLLTPEQAAQVGIEAAAGLDYAHRRGLVHRDIKPANLLFDADRRLRIADFGLARALAEASWTEPDGAILGTARYSAPEQVEGWVLDGKADVYALALVLYEGVTGEAPFIGDTTLSTLMARVGTLLPEHDALGPLNDVLVWAAAPEPGERYDASQLAVRLRAAAAALPEPEPLHLVDAVPVDEADEVDQVMVRPARRRTSGLDADLTELGAPGPISVAAAKAAKKQDRAAGEPPSPGIKRRWPRRVLVAVVAIAVVAAGVAYAVHQRVFTPSHPVPSLVGTSLARADAAVQGDHFTVHPVGHRFSLVLGAGPGRPHGGHRQGGHHHRRDGLCRTTTGHHPHPDRRHQLHPGRPGPRRRSPGRRVPGGGGAIQLDGGGRRHPGHVAHRHRPLRLDGDHRHLQGPCPGGRPRRVRGHLHLRHGIRRPHCPRVRPGPAERLQRHRPHRPGDRHHAGGLGAAALRVHRHRPGIARTPTGDHPQCRLADPGRGHQRAPGPGPSGRRALWPAGRAAGALHRSGRRELGAAGDHCRHLHVLSGTPVGCELCEAARITPWFHEDDLCWVAACEVCDVPMVVWKEHGPEPPDTEVEHMLAALGRVADDQLGEGGWSFDRVMRQIPDHFHAHARDPNWWFRRFGRR